MIDGIDMEGWKAEQSESVYLYIFYKININCKSINKGIKNKNEFEFE